MRIVNHTVYLTPRSRTSPLYRSHNYDMIGVTYVASLTVVAFGDASGVWGKPDII